MKDITTLAQEVLGLLADQGVALGTDLGQAEAQIRDLVLAIGRAALAEHLADKKLGYEGSSKACRCGGSQRFVGYRGKQVLCLLGDLRIQRAYYHCRSCGASSLPYDQATGLARSTASPGLRRAAALLGIQVPFAQGRQMLADLTGLRIGENTLRRLTEQAGSKADALEQQQARRIERWQAPEHPPVVGRLYNSADGAMVHLQDQQGARWQEVKTHVCYWQDAQQVRHARYVARLDPIEGFVGHVWALASACGLSGCRQSVLLGDAAGWIWERLGPLFDEAVQIVDWYHAVEHLWACGKALHGEGTEATRAWVEARKALLWESRLPDLLAALRAEQARRRGRRPREALAGLLGYLARQAPRLDYKKFRDQGLEIGSGTVESACRHVVQMRLKRAGTRWHPANAQAILSLRCCFLNGQWDAFWQTRPTAA